MIMYSLLFLIALLVSASSIPPIIRLAVQKRLFDVPLEDRKIHKKLIPNLGGIAIIGGTFLSYSLVADSYLFSDAGIILASGIIIATIGVKDDLVGITPYKKFAAQFAVAFLVTVLADIRITNLFGLFGVEELGYLPSVLLSIFSIIGIINAFNLIDGIDGLSGGISLIATLTYCVMFSLLGDIGWSYFACALAGAIVGFLIFNVSPADIFMGDTGALFIGFMMSLFTIRFLEIRQVHDNLWNVLSSEITPSFTVAVLIVPLFDTLRVFTIRILNSESPFKADRNHMHHRLLDVGMSHTQASLTLCGVTFVFMFVVWLIQDFGNFQVMLSVIILALLSNTMFTLYAKQKQQILEKKKQTQVFVSKEDSISEKELDTILKKIAEN